MELQLCKCGCGLPVLKETHTWLSGHWNKTPGGRQKIKDTTKGKPHLSIRGANHPMHRPEVKAKVSKKLLGKKRPKISAAKKGKGNPKIKGKNNAMHRPEVKVKFMGENNPMKRPECRKLMSEINKRRQTDPKYIFKIGLFGKWFNKWWRHYFMNEEHFKKQSEYMKNGGAAYARSKCKRPSKPQMKLFNLCCQLFPLCVLEYPIFCSNGKCFNIDIVLPQLAVAIEYDEPVWHQDKGADRIRQKEIEKQGWTFVRYPGFIPTKDQLFKDVNEAWKEAL